MNENEIKELRETIEAQKAELDKLREQNRLSAFKQAKSEILSPYEQDVKDGRLTPALLGKIESELNSQQSNFSEGSSLNISTVLAREIMLSAKIVEDTKADEVVEESFSEVADADEVLSKEIKNVMLSANVDYFTAQARVFDAKPELLNAYKQFTVDVSEGRL